MQAEEATSTVVINGTASGVCLHEVGAVVMTAPQRYGVLMDLLQVRQSSVGRSSTFRGLLLETPWQPA